MTRRYLAFAAFASLFGVAARRQRQVGNGGEEGADSRVCSSSATAICRDEEHINPRSEAGQSVDRVCRPPRRQRDQPDDGKEEPHGTRFSDVTDPRNRSTSRISGHPLNEAGNAESGGAQMVRICSGAELPRADKSKFYMLRAFGNTAGSAQEMWDVTDPARPTRIKVIVSGLRGTHKNWWECDTGIAYLVSGQPGWRVPRMTKISTTWATRQSRCSSAISVCRVNNPDRRERRRVITGSMAPFPPGPKATAFTLRMATCNWASCRSWIGKSC